MRTRFATITLLIVIGLCPVVFGQGVLNNFNFLGDGARGRAMGGAFISIADDGSALSWNPAGLIQVVYPQLSFSMDYFHPKATYNLTYANHPEMNSEHSEKDDKFPLSYASFTAPVRIRGHQFVASAVFSSIATRFDYFEANPDSGQLDPAEPVFLSEKADARLNQLRLGFGTNLYKNLNIGAGVDIYFGKGLVDTTFVYDSSYEVIYGPDTIDVFVIERSHVADTAKFTGLNLVGGLHWNDEKFGLGMTVKMPFWLTQKHVKWTSDTTFIGTEIDHLLPTADPVDIDENDKERIKVPWAVGFGASYNVTPNLLVASDFEWHRYGTSYIRHHYDTTLSSGDVEESYVEKWMHMENGYQLRFGAEYLLAAGFATMPLRAGFHYETMGFREPYDISYNFVDWTAIYYDSLKTSYDLDKQVTGYGLTFGVGLHWDLVKLDFALEYNTCDVNQKGVDFYGPYEGVREYRGTRFIMNFTGLFK